MASTKRGMVPGCSVTNPARSFVRHSLLRPEPIADSMVLRSTPDDKSDDESSEIETPNETESSSILDKINDFLDTPILDANNRSDQGAVAETLKEFVRDEPEIAQVTFSVVVVAVMVVVTKAVTSL